MSLRTAEPADLAAIMRLERESFPSDAWSEPLMREELASPHGRYVVDVEGGRLLGYGGVRAVSGAGDADIQTIAMAPDARGRGRGRALLRELLASARQRGARHVFLEVRADNPAASALYVSEGFVEIGRRPRYYQPDDVDAVIMKLDLAGWDAHRVHPRGEGVHPRGEGVHPRGEGVHPRGEGVHPRGEGVHPRGEGVHPRGGEQATTKGWC